MRRWAYARKWHAQTQGTREEFTHHYSEVPDNEKSVRDTRMHIPGSKTDYTLLQKYRRVYNSKVGVRRPRLTALC